MATFCQKFSYPRLLQRCCRVVESATNIVAPARQFVEMIPFSRTIQTDGALPLEQLIPVGYNAQAMTVTARVGGGGSVMLPLEAPRDLFPGESVSYNADAADFLVLTGGSATGNLVFDFVLVRS